MAPCETDLYRRALEHFDRLIVRRAMDIAEGQQFRAAEILGLSRVTLRGETALARHAHRQGAHTANQWKNAVISHAQFPMRGESSRARRCFAGLRQARRGGPGQALGRLTATVAKGRDDADWLGFAREVSESAGL